MIPEMNNWNLKVMPYSHLINKMHVKDVGSKGKFKSDQANVDTGLSTPSRFITTDISHKYS